MVVAIPEFKLAYMPVPKAACSSVKSALALIDPGVSIELADIQRDNIIMHAIYPTERFKPYLWRQYKDWWKFTVVRDPIERLLSVYSDRVVGREELKNSRNLRKQTQLPTNPDPDFFFQNIRGYMKLASVIKHHVLTSRLFTGADFGRFDDVFTVNEIPRLESILSERVGTPVTIPRLNSSNKKLAISDLQQTTQDNLAEFLKGEYHDLSDYFTNPFR